MGLSWSSALGKVGSKWDPLSTIVPPHLLGSQYEVCSLSVAIPVTDCNAEGPAHNHGMTSGAGKRQQELRVAALVLQNQFSSIVDNRQDCAPDMYDMNDNILESFENKISVKESAKAEKPSQKENQRKESKPTLNKKPIKEEEQEKAYHQSAKMTKEAKMPLSFTSPDTGLTFSMSALLDSGATDSFIDKGMINKYGLMVVHNTATANSSL
jgi:hypothetical protein